MARLVIAFLCGLVLTIIVFRGIEFYQAATSSSDEEFQDRINTTLLNFDVEWLIEDPRRDPRFMGGFGLHEAGVFVGEGSDEGGIYFIFGDGDELVPTGLTLPRINRAQMPTKTASGREVDTGLLRYNDLAIVPVGGRELLVVSYSYWKPDEACFVSRLATTALPDGWVDGLRSGGRPLEGGVWQEVWESTPCLPVRDTPGVFTFTFTGHQAGGRIAVTDAGPIYMTVGDYQFDGEGGRYPAHPQKPDTSYGKIMRMQPAASGPWPFEIVSTGHRNPQGITVDNAGRVWAVEHAAMGGDELNLIVDGANYGYPLVTLGINYTDFETDEKFWPFNKRQGRHEGFVEPVYAWMPSIAPSSVKVIEALDPRWDGDLLVGSLKYGQLVRVHLSGDRVQVAEHISFRRRVRYAEVGHGRIYVLFDYGELAILTPREMAEDVVEFSIEEPAGGAVATPQNPVAAFGCLQCHSDPALPRLAGLVGKEIASQPRVDYSNALGSVPGTWTPENLRAFLTDTQAFAPGSTMPEQQLSPADIDSLIGAMTAQQ